MSALAMPQYSGNLNASNQPDVHQVPTHYNHLVQQTQHSGYASGFHPNASLMSQNYSGSVHFQPSFDYAAKSPNEEYKYPIDQKDYKYPVEQLKMSPPPTPQQTSTALSVQPSSALPTTAAKPYSEHMPESNWSQMYGHHQVYGPPNEYSQMQQNYINPNAKYWSWIIYSTYQRVKTNIFLLASTFFRRQLKFNLLNKKFLYWK